VKVQTPFSMPLELQMMFSLLVFWKAKQQQQQQSKSMSLRREGADQMILST
jgi:hypothetical protein